MPAQAPMDGAPGALDMPKSGSGRSGLVMAGLCMLMAACVSGAGARERGDHDRARLAVEAGQIVPLKTVLARVEREFPGQILEVELERHSPHWVYEIKVLQAGGVLRKLKFDARDGTPLTRRDRKSEAETDTETKKEKEKD